MGHQRPRPCKSRTGAFVFPPKFSPFLAPRPHVLAAMIAQQDRSHAGVPLEQYLDQLLLVRPGIGENHVEIIRAKANLLARRVRAGGEPAEAVAVLDAALALPRNETAADEL